MTLPDAILKRAKSSEMTGTGHLKHRKLKQNTPISTETPSMENARGSDPNADKNSLPEVQLGKMSAASAHRRRMKNFSGRESYL